ncbi:MAG TPA: cbb3-type cytochrome c oxidase subunit II [Edaphocola sp.]|nr:cbb3-type cytochrome c oxidase subunit II [Edaphocola sp.]
MLNFHNNHKNLVITSAVVYIGLSILIAVLPAFKMQEVKPLPSMKPMTSQEMSGLKMYTAENCMACHTQQVRNIEMDKMWGDRPSIAADYYYSKKRLDFWRQSPSTLGSERTGPDLTNVGKRQPSKDWQLMHLYNPRSVVKESIMPGFPWLFEEKDSTQIKKGDVVVAIPAQFLKNKNKKIVAKQQALDLVAYLLSLKQPDLGGEPDWKFIPAAKKEAPVATAGGVAQGLDGGALYANTCATCHQADGKGVAGTFPSLAGSKIVNDPNPEQLITIVLDGYTGLVSQGYPPMPPFGESLTDEEIAAITTHERSSWGNNAPPVKPEDVKKVRDYLKTVSKK